LRGICQGNFFDMINRIFRICLVFFVPGFRMKLGTGNTVEAYPCFSRLDGKFAMNFRRNPDHKFTAK